MGTPKKPAEELTDDHRLKLIERAFLECGVTPTKEQLEKQFKVETGRKPGEPYRWKGGNRRRV